MRIARAAYAGQPGPGAPVATKDAHAVAITSLAATSPASRICESTWNTNLCVASRDAYCSCTHIRRMAAHTGNAYAPRAAHGISAACCTHGGEGGGGARTNR